MSDPNTQRRDWHSPVREQHATSQPMDIGSAAEDGARAYVDPIVSASLSRDHQLLIDDGLIPPSDIPSDQLFPVRSHSSAEVFPRPDLLPTSHSLLLSSHVAEVPARPQQIVDASAESDGDSSSGGQSLSGIRPVPTGLSHRSSTPQRARWGWPSLWWRPAQPMDKEDHATAEEATAPTEESTETSALLGGRVANGAPLSRVATGVSRKSGDPGGIGEAQTTWQRETKILIRYAAPLIVAFVLQMSLNLTSIFIVGHIGTIELGAVSLASLTFNITGSSVYHGLVTALDTLCAQAYGSGQKKLVGLQLQRMVLCLWLVTIPLAVFWGFATPIIEAVVPEKDIALMAGRYLQILIIGAPGYAAFEAGKRFVQAQGMFNVTLYILLICAPLNVFLQWLFVWHFQWGYIGCPIAIDIVELLMPTLLVLYVRFVKGMECWPGFTRNAFRNWGPMIRLAIPGLVMVMAEYLAFEILTLAAASISAVHLAANQVLLSLSSLAFQLPFPLSIAASTRIANLIGAGLPAAGLTATRVAFVLSIFVGLLNCTLLLSLRYYIPWLFSEDPAVIELVIATLPVNAAFQLLDATAAQCNGILRSLAKQAFGGYVNLFSYYAIGVPLAFWLCFGLHLDLYGLWIGPALGLLVVTAIEGFYIYRMSYEQAAEDAARRNAIG